MLDVPAVMPELSSRQVLTTEFIEGIPLDRCEELDQDTRDQVTNQFLLPPEIPSPPNIPLSFLTFSLVMNKHVS